MENRSKIFRDFVTKKFLTQILQEQNLGMIGIDSRRSSFVRREHYRLVNPMETLNAKSTVSPYFGAKEFAFALV